MRRELLVHLGFDLEPNRKRFGGQGFDSRQPSPWKCHEVVFPFVRAARDRFEQEASLPLRFTWYVRADTCIGEVYGRPSWALEEFREALAGMGARGDDVGIHPHSWRWDVRRHRWFQEATDRAWLTDCVAASVESFRRVMGCAPLAAHAGFDYMDNFLLRLLEQLGVKMVIAPVPGVHSRGIIVEGGARTHFFDWRRAPAHPYFASRTDYQRPGVDATALLFVPNTIVIQPWASYLFHLSPIRNPQRLPPWWRKEEICGYPDHSQPGEGTWRLGRTRLYRPKWERSYYYVPPIVLPLLVRKGVEAAIKNCPGWQRVPMAVGLVTDELLDEATQRLFEDDLRLLVAEANRHGLQLRFVNAQELFDAVMEELQQRTGWAA